MKVLTKELVKVFQISELAFKPQPSDYPTRMEVINYLPEEIQRRIKDKSLLALGLAEQDIKQMISDYIKDRVQAALSVIDKSLENSLKAVSGLTIENQIEKQPYFETIDEVFEESVITAVEKKGNDIYIELDNDKIIGLTEAVTIEQEVNPENAFIRFFELHKEKQSYELHLLIMVYDSSLVEHYYYLTYGFKDMTINII